MEEDINSEYRQQQPNVIRFYPIPTPRMARSIIVRSLTSHSKQSYAYTSHYTPHVVKDKISAGAFLCV